MRNLSLAVSIVIAAILVPVRPALAVDNSTHILGLGADTSFSSEGILPQLSVKFALTKRIELAVLFGLSISGATTASPTEAAFMPGLKFDYVLIPEKYMNFYVQGSISVDLRSDTGLNSFLYGAGPGVEFFLSEMPNLGLALEFGVRGSVAATTAGFPAPTIENPNENTSNFVTAFGGAGIHYYF